MTSTRPTTDVADSASPLGKPSEYTDTYTPSLLHSIERSDVRGTMDLTDAALPFQGEDVWMAYELSWLNSRGKPEVSAVRIKVPCSSPCIVESKSFKLYLGSLSQSRFAHRADVLSTLNSDLGIAFHRRKPGRAAKNYPDIFIERICYCRSFPRNINLGKKIQRKQNQYGQNCGKF